MQLARVRLVSDHIWHVFLRARVNFRLDVKRVKPLRSRQKYELSINKPQNTLETYRRQL